MSGNGASQNQASAPWAAASPYIQQILQSAGGLYGAQAPTFNPASGFNYGSVTGGVNNAITGNTNLGSIAAGTTPQTTTALNHALSGTPDYTAVNGAVGAANQQQWDDFYNNVVPQLNQRASFLGNPSGAIKDMNSTVTNIARNQSANADQAYLGQYTDAQNRALQAAGLGGSIAGQAGSQSLQGASLYPTISQLPNASLTDYANVVNSTTSPFGTTSKSISPGSGAGFMNALGGGLGLADLAGKLFGSSGGSPGIGTQAYNGIKNWLGGGSSAGGASGIGASGGSLAGIGGTGAGAGITGIGDAGAADIAAAGAQPIGAGLGSGAAVAGGADAAGTTAGLGAQVATGAETAGITPEFAGATTIGTEASGGGAAAGAGGLGSGASAGGSLAGGAAGAAVPVAIAAFGASRQPYDLKAQYWDNLNTQLTKGTSGNATYDKSTPAAMQQYSAKGSLYQMLQQAGPSGNLTSSDFGKGGNQIPANIRALAKSYGMLNADGSLNKNWSQKQPVAASAANGWGTRLSTNTYIDPSMSAVPQGSPGGRAY